MKILTLTMAALLTSVVVPAAYAQPAPVSTVASSASLTDGEVRKVDKEARKITIKHGEIKNLEMPGMTMVFQVKDSVLLDGVKVGDKVKFVAEKSGGSLVVTDIQPAK